MAARAPGSGLRIYDACARLPQLCILDCWTQITQVDHHSLKQVPFLGTITPLWLTESSYAG
ncbi:hypothetical protein RRG08_006842 [Elysia crispata]|uniref:Uncharacterized protein n=1 Tax=Elysia crispata TaxID=231223 RepID=A0AAE0XW55_9GAST|nr:hypothetical protein RRG08_006842 [Elysia crispata]